MKACIQGLATSRYTYLFRFIVTIDFDAEKLSLFLPVQANVGNVEKILYSDLSSLRNRKDGNSGWNLIFFWHPERQHVFVGRPEKFAEMIIINVN